MLTYNFHKNFQLPDQATRIWNLVAQIKFLVPPGKWTAVNVQPCQLITRKLHVGMSAMRTYLNKKIHFILFHAKVRSCQSSLTGKSMGLLIEQFDSISGLLTPPILSSLNSPQLLNPRWRPRTKICTISTNNMPAGPHILKNACGLEHDFQQNNTCLYRFCFLLVITIIIFVVTIIVI